MNITVTVMMTIIFIGMTLIVEEKLYKRVLKVKGRLSEINNEFVIKVVMTLTVAIIAINFKLNLELLVAVMLSMVFNIGYYINRLNKLLDNKGDVKVEDEKTS